MVEVMEKLCGSSHGVMALSLFTCGSSLILMIVTVPPTFSVVYCLLSNESGKFKGMFYKLLLNIAIADLMKGIIADVASVNYHFREAIAPKTITISDTYAIHLSMFLSDAIALVTMTFLSIDRLLALLKPHQYHQGLSNLAENFLIFLAWPIGILIVFPYLWLSYIRELAFFTAVNVLVATIALVVTAVVYRVKFRVLESSSAARWRKRPTDFEYSNSSTSIDERSEDQPPWKSVKRLPSTENLRHGTDASTKASRDSFTCISLETKFSNGGNTTTVNEDRESATSTPQSRCHAGLDRVKSSGNLLQVPGSPVGERTKQMALKLKSRTHVQKRVTRTFMLMLLVFIVSYLPTCVMMIYMNLCTACNCTLIHVMRDMSAIAILSSSTLRTFNFIFTLKHLKKAVKKLLRQQCDCREGLKL